MQFIFKDQITDKLLFVIQRFELALKRTSDVADCDDLLRTPEVDNLGKRYTLGKVADCDDLLRTPEGVDLFDATCMRIQTIGEALKQIDTETKEKLLVYYPGIPWRKIFAMRNIISHEYLSVDPEIITDIVKHNLSPLLVVLYRIQDDLNAGKHDAIFG